MEKKRERVLVEVDADLKKLLKARLALEGKTLKGWFEEQARLYLRRDK